MSFFDCAVRLRVNPVRHKEVVRIGCGAGFAGDRPSAALKLLLHVPHMDYLVLECLAERTLAFRHEAMLNGGVGFDPRISEWMSLLLPEAVKRRVCIITNMGAVDPLGAQAEVFKVAKCLGLSITVGVVSEIFQNDEGAFNSGSLPTSSEKGLSTYLGAAPIVHVLEVSKPNVVITSRVADASLFVAPMVFELGWNWNDYQELAQATLAGHLLECGCQVTGGYFMHPIDEHRDFSFRQLVETSLPYGDISWLGDVIIAKREKSGGELSFATCAQQLLYEIGNPAAYITPDMIVDFTNVTFHPLTENKMVAKGARQSCQRCPGKLLRLIAKECGWKGWGEISYGGAACSSRARAADYLVRSWIEEAYPGINSSILSYVIGIDSLRIQPLDKEVRDTSEVSDIRLRMDGLFVSKEQALRFIQEFEALYTNGPAGGGGISTGYKKEIFMEKLQVAREEVFWKTFTNTINHVTDPLPELATKYASVEGSILSSNADLNPNLQSRLTIQQFVPDSVTHSTEVLPAPRNIRIPLYKVAHSRTGDKGNTLNFSIIPHCPEDILKLKQVITQDWVKFIMKKVTAFDNILYDSRNGPSHVSPLIHAEENVDVEIYDVPGIRALNVVVKNVLDGGVNCSRRIDRHGKSLSDCILCQMVTLH